MAIRTFARLLVALTILASIVLNSSCGNDNFVVNPATLCSCDASIEGPCFIPAERLRFAKSKTLEVLPTDLSNGEFIGTACEGEPGAITNVWRPVDGWQHSLVGNLEHFNWSYDDDEDWNIHVIPDSSFSFLIDDVEALHPGSKSWHNKCNGPQCMEAEISPDKQFWTNPWFFAPGTRPEDRDRNGWSTLEGRQMGFYGPWVMDMDHSFGSEIHPIHMMWFTDHFAGGIGGSGGPFDIFWLMFLQDNTGRFDDRDDFDCGGSAPSWWKPWTDAPRSGRFEIAFEVNPATEVVSFYIEGLFKRFVVTSQDADASMDADNGTSHGLEVNGKVVVRVQEDQEFDDDLGVTFTNLCIGSDGKLRGFVSIRSKIGGNDDRDEEGFHILYATRSVRKTRPDVVRPDIGDLPVVLITSKEVAGSLGLDGDHFTGDLLLTLHGNKRTTDDDYTIAKVEFASQYDNQELKFEQDKRAKEVRIKKLPLVGGTIQVTTASGRTLTIVVPSIALSPAVEETITRSAIDNTAGKFLASSVGGVIGVPVPFNSQLSNFQELSIKLQPRYVAYKGKEEVTDRPSVFAKELNDMLAKRGAMVSADRPSTVSWTFEATNLANGQPLPIYTNNSATTLLVRKDGRVTDGVQIQLPATNSVDESIKIKFPAGPTTGIAELQATATVTDIKGKTSVVEHRLWSHGFQDTINSVEDYASLVQALTGLKDKSVLIVPQPKVKPVDLGLPPNVKTRRAYILSSYLQGTLSDKRVTVEELRNIVQALKRFSMT